MFQLLLGPYLAQTRPDMAEFSENLIQETIAVFKDEDGFDISPEIANEYLEALSGLFLAFARPSILDDGQTSPDLIYPHSCKK